MSQEKTKTKWNPFKELEEMQNKLSSLFEMGVDRTEDEKEYLIKAELPDVNKEDVNVSVENSILTITGKRREKKGVKPFERSFPLTDEVDPDKITAGYKDGVLSIHLPKITRSRREIQVREIPLIDAVYKRLKNAVTDILKGADTHQLAEVLEAPSDTEVMLRVLRTHEAVISIRRQDPLAAARVRGIEARKRLVEAEGGSFSASEVADFLHLSRQAVDKRRKENRLIGLDVGRHGYIYPGWQFSKCGTLKGLEETLADLKDHDPWMKVQFMLQPNSRLDDRRPLDVLNQGEIASVRAAARALGEHGAA